MTEHAHTTERRPGAVRPVSGLPGLAWAVLACVALAVLSLLAPSTPSYDPWAWIVWGREVAALELDTRFGPSWKPLPVLFTTPFSLFGDAAPELWLVVARAGALMGLVAAFQLARRLGGTVAGVLAALGLALSGGYLRGAAIGYSEGLLVALVLLAVDRHLDGGRRGALALGFAAGLLRPETWPFLGLYALYVFVREPRARLLAAGLVALLPVLWLGPELLGAGDALRAASRAREPTLFSPAFADRPALAVFDRAQGFVPGPTKLGVLAAVVVAALSTRAGGGSARPRGAGRRCAGARAWAAAASRGTPAARVTLALAAAAAAWLALVAVMTELGYAGNSRYLAVPIALACVVGGVGLGWALRGVSASLGRTGRPGRAALAVVARRGAGRALHPGRRRADRRFARGRRRGAAGRRPTRSRRARGRARARARLWAAARDGAPGARRGLAARGGDRADRDRAAQPRCPVPGPARPAASRRARSGADGRGPRADREGRRMDGLGALPLNPAGR